jgi:hypothetical protein
MAYDSTADTMQHIDRVRELLTQVTNDLQHRATQHDASKLKEPEKSAFDTFTPKLKDLTYGSDEYRATLKQMKPAVEHHYSVNSHHPEFHGKQGVSGMSLMDLIEMLCDWKAAGERHKDGDIWTSLDKNRERFFLDQASLYAILANTARELKW